MDLFISDSESEPSQECAYDEDIGEIPPELSDNIPICTSPDPFAKDTLDLDAESSDSMFQDDDFDNVSMDELNPINTDFLDKPLPSFESGDRPRLAICSKPFRTEEEWDLPDFSAETFKTLILDSDEFLVWLAKRRLIANESYCVQCPTPSSMNLSRDGSDIFQWRCRKCGKRKQIRVRSVFEKIKAPMDILIYLLYMWCNGSSFDEMCTETGLSGTIISTWLDRLRAICSWQLQRCTDRLEGVVEIAEGAYLDAPPICALAGVERFGSRCFLVRLPQQRCNQKLLLRFIRNRIAPGSTIITSDWEGYRPLKELPDGYIHLITDHQQNVHVNKADDLLEELANFIDSVQTSCREHFSSILDEFVWRKLTTSDRFAKACYSLAHIYNTS